MEKEPTERSSHGGKIEANLGEDLLIEILSRLPIKPLFRFRCVSRYWCSLITGYSDGVGLLKSLSGFFYEVLAIDGNGHLKRREYGYACLSKNRTDLSLDFVPSYPDLAVLHCCNGLVLCLSGGSGGTDCDYYVCNPLCRRWVGLPRPCGEAARRNARLVCDADEGSGHFKVVLCCNRSLQIFSSRTGKWVDSYTLIQGVNISCWGYRRSPVINPIHTQKNHGVIELPPEAFPSRGLLREYTRGYNYHPQNSYRLETRMLQDCESGNWGLKNGICCRGLYEGIGRTGRRCPLSTNRATECIRFLGFSPDEDTLFFREHCKIYQYSVATMRVEEVCSLPCEKNIMYRFSPFVYSPSLDGLRDAHRKLQFSG